MKNLTLSLVIVSFASALSATTIFTDRTEWENAIAEQGLGNIQTEDFNSTTPGALPKNATTNVGLLDIEVIVPENAKGVTTINDGTGEFNFDGSNYLHMGLDGTPKREVNITFSGPIVAWGADFGTRNTFSDDPEVTFGDDQERLGQIIPGGLGNSSFVGFISEDPFDFLNFKDPSVSTAVFGADNLSFVQLDSSVPEPSTFVFLAMAVFGLAFFKRA